MSFDPAAIAPGEIGFFGSPGSLNHVAIHVGDGQMVQARHTGDVVRTAAFDGYWRTEFAGSTKMLSG